MTRVPNIGRPGIQRRRRQGLVWLALTGVTIVLLVVFHAPQAARLVIAIPVGLAVFGLLQASEKT
jgi:hypothetical protein